MPESPTAAETIQLASDIAGTKQAKKPCRRAARKFAKCVQRARYDKCQVREERATASNKQKTQRHQLTAAAAFVIRRRKATF